MRPREFARRVADRHRRRGCEPPRLAMTLLRRGAHPVQVMVRRADMHAHRWSVRPRVAVHVDPTLLRAGAAAHPPARAARSPRRPAERVVPVHRAPAPAPAAGAALVSAPVGGAQPPAPLGPSSPLAAAGITPVPRVMQRTHAAPTATASQPHANALAAATAAARAGGTAAVPAAQVAQQVAVAAAPAIEVERITDQVVAAIDRRILTRRERLGRV